MNNKFAKFADLLVNNGIKIMIAGVSIMAVGILFFIQQQHKNQQLRQIAFFMTAVGIGLYALGRICVIIAARRSRKMREQASKESEEKELS